MLISFNTPHGALIQKPTISGGFSIRENRQTKVSANLGINEDRGTVLGAKILDKTLRMNGDKLTKVREESPRVTLKYQKGGGREVRGARQGAAGSRPSHRVRKGCSLNRVLTMGGECNWGPCQEATGSNPTQGASRGRSERKKEKSQGYEQGESICLRQACFSSPSTE